MFLNTFASILASFLHERMKEWCERPYGRLHGHETLGKGCLRPRWFARRLLDGLTRLVAGVCAEAHPPEDQPAENEDEEGHHWPASRSSSW